MRLGILWWEPGEVECLGIAEACRERGHEVVLFGLEDIGCEDTPMGTVPTVAGRRADAFDAVLSRAHIGADNWRDAVERLTLLSGTPGTLMLDPVSAHVRTVSKFAMLHQLTRSGIRVPPTRSVRTVADVEKAVDRWGRIVLKPSVGFRGIDVERFAHGFGLGERAKASALLDRYGVLICQPYIPHEGDHRVLVIGEEPSVCTRFHTGGDAWKPFPGDGLPPGESWDVRIEVRAPSREMADLGIRATKAMGLSYAGVDIVETEDGPVVMEVNVVPGWGALPPDVQRIPNRAVADLVERRTRELGPV
ncbi:RimK family alpha-L-glutamate ligase [Streptomyces scabiei]|uniref:ATP-grasp domain-containing protein n=1 Tax=Streptomyces scabiei TaxID=1930 RepID=UPI00369EC4A5